VIKLLLVDDLACVREGLRMRLGLEPDLQVVGEAGDGAEALTLASSLQPDVIVMDVEMPGMDGLAATAALRGADPGCAIVTLSLHDDIATRRRAHVAGARAFVAKHQPVDHLLAAIRSTASPRNAEPTIRASA
jgi:two-component system response regulator DesR